MKIRSEHKLAFLTPILLVFGLCIGQKHLADWNFGNNTPPPYATGAGDMMSVSTADYINPAFFDSVNKKNIQEILDRQIGVIAEDSDLVKTEKIGKFLIGEMSGLIGDPPPFKNITYYDFWKKIENKEAVVACYEFSAMYALFANSIGLPTRIVYIINRTNPNQQLYHAVAESFFEEKKSWYMVDLTYNQLYVLDSSQTPVDAKTYGGRVKQDRADHLIIQTSQNQYVYGSSSHRHYDSKLKEQSKYYKGDSTVVYEVVSKRVEVPL